VRQARSKLYTATTEWTIGQHLRKR